MIVKALPLRAMKKKVDEIAAKRERERRIFHSFMEVAHLPVLPDSVKNQREPAPDILCEIQGRGHVAFELVEIVMPAFRRELDSGQKLKKTFEAESQKQPHMKLKFQDAIIHVGFFKTRPINQCLLFVPKVIAELVKSKIIAGYKKGRYSCLSTVATNLLAEAFNASDNLKIIFRVGDFNPRSSWLMYVR